MDFIVAILVEIVVELVADGAKSKRLSKYIRYPLIAIIVLFCMALIGIMIFIGIRSLHQDTRLSVSAFVFAVVLIVFSIIKLRKSILHI